MFRCSSVLAFAALLLLPAAVEASDLPHLRIESGASQLIVHGKPYVILGGELGNSSAGTVAQTDDILPRLARMHVNTVLMPVAWEQIEPLEGQFDFSILDHWMDIAQQNKVHLVLLRFGSWKNGFSNYAPAWVKADTNRFPRALSAAGESLEILSTLGAETVRSDSRAFGKLMAHVGEHDAEQQTVLMVQVENEVGCLGRGRDRSAEADKEFKELVPDKLKSGLNSRRLSLSPELAVHFAPAGHTWTEVFGDAANEVFMAGRYASYIEHVAAAGKLEYALPMYVNAQLPAAMERAGEYPSGGPPTISKFIVLLRRVSICTLPTFIGQNLRIG
jgi:beta-galactosidase GanA